jgi:hypothetical protein
LSSPADCFAYTPFHPPPIHPFPFPSTTHIHSPCMTSRSAQSLLSDLSNESDPASRACPHRDYLHAGRLWGLLPQQCICSPEHIIS